MINGGDYIPMNPEDGHYRREGGDDGRAKRLAKLQRLVRLLYRFAQKIEEAAEDLQFFVDGLQEEDIPALHRERRPGPCRPGSVDDAEVLKQLAKLGVAVKMVRDPDGSATVAVGQCQPFRLESRTLADLLEILCEDSGPRNDGLVGFKSADELARRLGEKHGRAPTRHSIAVSILRLRTALAAHGINKFLVQSHRQMGYRFARKVKEPLEIVGQS